MKGDEKKKGQRTRDDEITIERPTTRNLAKNTNSKKRKLDEDLEMAPSPKALKNVQGRRSGIRTRKIPVQEPLTVSYPNKAWNKWLDWLTFARLIEERSGKLPVKKSLLQSGSGWMKGECLHQCEFLLFERYISKIRCCPGQSSRLFPHLSPKAEQRNLEGWRSSQPEI